MVYDSYRTEIRTTLIAYYGMCDATIANSRLFSVVLVNSCGGAEYNRKNKLDAQLFDTHRHEHMQLIAYLVQVVPVLSHLGLGVSCFFVFVFVLVTVHIRMSLTQANMDGEIERITDTTVVRFSLCASTWLYDV